jgi:hypothetical protein
MLSLSWLGEVSTFTMPISTIFTMLTMMMLTIMIFTILISSKLIVGRLAQLPFLGQLTLHLQQNEL